MRQIWVDFNDVDTHGLATTLAKFAESGVSLDVGQRLVAGDEEGNVCDAIVVDRGTDGAVILALDLGTFHEDCGRAALAI